MAKAKDPTTIDEIKTAIEEKETEVARLQGEIDQLRQNALNPIRELAESLGYTLTAKGTTPAKSSKPKSAMSASKEEVEGWLRGKLAKSPMAYTDLAKAYKAELGGTRLLLHHYADTVTKADDGQVSLTPKAKKLA